MASFNLPKVILPLMIFGCFRVSDMVAKGIVQLSTGPQKCVLKVGEKRRKIKWLLFHKLFTHVCIYIYIYIYSSSYKYTEKHVFLRSSKPHVDKSYQEFRMRFENEQRTTHLTAVPILISRPFEAAPLLPLLPPLLKRGILVQWFMFTWAGFTRVTPQHA